MTETTQTKSTVQTKEALVAKYFDGFKEYTRGNMAVVSLLSDIQHMCDSQGYENESNMLNDIKAVLINQHKALLKD